MRFRSKAEETFHNYLKKIKVFGDYESVKIPYTVQRSYLPDFALSDSSGKVRFYVEVKGYLKPSDRTKLLSVQRLNPGLDLRLVFMQDNWLNKTHTTRYSGWCKKNGFKYTIGLELPKEWIYELRKPNGSKRKRKSESKG